MPPGDIAPLIIGLAITFSVTAIIIFRGPLGRALIRKLDSGSVPDDMAQRVSHLEAHVSELELLASRMDELENRVDFSERVLAGGENRNRKDPHHA